MYKNTHTSPSPKMNGEDEDTPADTPNSGPLAYERVRTIGKGSYGTCHLCTKKVNKEQVVVKEIDVDQMSAEEREGAIKEVQILSILQHESVIAYYESFLSNDNRTLNIVMEYADDGDMFTKTQTNEYYSETQILDWFEQIARGLHYVHSMNILHRDLKTQNIFLTRNGVVKLGDFGIAKVLNSTNDLAKTVIGTPYYLSPEVCEDQGYNRKSDVWALGCVLYEMTTLKHAFDGQNLPALILRIIKGVYPPIPTQYTGNIRLLIRVLLQKNPKKRPSMRDVLRIINTMHTANNPRRAIGPTEGNYVHTPERKEKGQYSNLDWMAARQRELDGLCNALRQRTVEEFGQSMLRASGEGNDVNSNGDENMYDGEHGEQIDDEMEVDGQTHAEEDISTEQTIVDDRLIKKLEHKKMVNRERERRIREARDRYGRERLRREEHEAEVSMAEREKEERRLMYLEKRQQAKIQRGRENEERRRRMLSHKRQLKALDAKKSGARATKKSEKPRELHSVASWRDAREKQRARMAEDRKLCKRKRKVPDIEIVLPSSVGVDETLGNEDVALSKSQVSRESTEFCIESVTDSLGLSSDDDQSPQTEGTNMLCTQDIVEADENPEVVGVKDEIRNYEDNKMIIAQKGDAKHSDSPVSGDDSEFDAVVSMNESAPVVHFGPFSVKEYSPVERSQSEYISTNMGEGLDPDDFGESESMYYGEIFEEPEESENGQDDDSENVVGVPSPSVSQKLSQRIEALRVYCDNVFGEESLISLYLYVKGRHERGEPLVTEDMIKLVGTSLIEKLGSVPYVQQLVICEELFYGRNG